MHLELNAHRIAYDDLGPRDAPVVVLGHCFGANRLLWEAQTAALAGFRVIRYDTRGHHESTTPPGPYRLDDLGDDVIALLDSLNIEQAHFVGISMSGMVGQNLALRFPKRLRSLGLITTTCGYSEQGKDAWRAWVATVRSAGTAAIADTLLTRWFSPQARAVKGASGGASGHPSGNSNEHPAVTYMREAILNMPSEAFIHIGEAVVRDLAYDAELPRIDLPTLVVASPTDPGIPQRTSLKLYTDIPKASLHWISPSHHLATLEQPHRFSPILRSFLLAQPH